MKKSFFFVLLCISFLINTSTLAQSPGDILITELMPNPSIGSDANEEWLELYNTTGSAIDIEGWVLADLTGSHTIVSSQGTTVVPAGGFLVMTRQATNSCAPTDYDFETISLNNSNETITLSDGGTTITSVSYTSSTAAVSLELKDINVAVANNGIITNGDLQNATNVMACGESGSPGALGNTTLPVELISFEAKAKENSIILSWKTASEEDNDYFEIEHSKDGIEFFPIEKITGAGTTFEEQTYQFNHRKPFDGSNYYRLKQVDFDGGFGYSGIESEYLRKPISWRLFPTQSNEGITIDWSNNFKAESISIFDINGKMVHFEKLDSESRRTYISITNFPSGSYFLKMQSGRSISSKRFYKIQ